VKTLHSLHLRVAFGDVRPSCLSLNEGCCTKRPRPGHIPGAGVSYSSNHQRGASMCKTLKTDIKLFAAASGAN
jgi:hypothetical protein